MPADALPEDVRAACERVREALPSIGATQTGYVTEWHSEPTDSLVRRPRLLTTDDLLAVLATVERLAAECERLRERDEWAQREFKRWSDAARRATTTDQGEG